MSLWNILGRYTVSRTDACAEAEDTAIVSQLLRLPPEIILFLAELLPRPSATCLALSCRHLNNILGPEVYRSLKSEVPEIQFAFLSTLAKDLPKHFVCYECACLHRISAVKLPRLTTDRLGSRCTWRWQSDDYRPRFWSRYQIYFPHVHLAIKQHHCGRDIGFPLEAFRYLEVDYTCAQQKTTLLSVDAQIVSNEFLMRSQTWILLPWSRRNEYVDGLSDTGLSFDICMHQRDGYMRKNPVSDLIESRLDHLEVQEKCVTQTMQCPYCWIDYEIDAIDFGDQGFAIVVTRWINLGAGLDAADTKWRSHFTRPVAGLAKPYHSRAQGEIRLGFESQAELPLDEFTADNKMKLFSRRYNSVWRRGSDGLEWKWDRGDRWYLAPSGPPEKSFWETLFPTLKG